MSSPAYPITVGAVGVEWRIHMAQAVNETRGIQESARCHLLWCNELDNWLGDWLRHATGSVFSIVLPIGLTLLAAVIAVVAYSHRQLEFSQVWMFLCVPIVALGGWFFSAPDIRFAGSFLWIIAVGIVTLTMMGCQQLTHRYQTRVILGLALILSLWSIRLLLVVGPVWIEVGSEGSLHPMPITAPVTIETESGLILYTPISGDQCWNAPLLCTPYPNPGLHLRETDNLGAGFVIDAPEN